MIPYSKVVTARSNMFEGLENFLLEFCLANLVYCFMPVLVYEIRVLASVVLCSNNTNYETLASPVDDALSQI